MYLLLFILLNAISSCPDEPFCTNCTIHNSERFCAKCTYSVYNNKTAQCSFLDSPIANCVEYKQSTTLRCAQCEYGFNLTSGGRCKPCKVKGCAICRNEISKCQSCHNGILPYKNKCYGSKTSICKISNCDICDPSNIVCLKCKKNHSIGKGLRCVPGIYGCNKLAPDGMRCDICDYGFYITKDNKCLPNNELNGFNWIAILLGLVLLIALLGLYIIYKISSNRKIQDLETLSSTTEQDYYVPVY